MKKSRTRFLLPVIGGIILISAGVIFLLNNLGLLALNWGMIVGPIFGIGGLIFLLVFILNTDEWWALIPGLVLIALGINFFMGRHSERLQGTIFLGFLGLAFLLIYISHREHWWAIIPGGVLFTLAGVTLVEENAFLSGGIFFVGLAATFGLIYILPKPSGKLTWALYPAGVLLVIGILVILGAQNLMRYIFPLVLLGVGGYVLFKALKK